jgi:hypothetical protein
MVAPPNIPGAETLVEWFGIWPSFHDAEIMSLCIDRERQASSMRIRAFTLSDRIDSNGRFVREREALVVFDFAGIKSLHIEGEDADTQNVISSLLVEETDGGYRVVLGPCYGLAGEIVVKDLRVKLETTFQP